MFCLQQDAMAWEGDAISMAGADVAVNVIDSLVLYSSLAPVGKYYANTVQAYMGFTFLKQPGHKQKGQKRTSSL